ncbi:hypothetical protein TNCV_2180121 [Trichonephila clavipes]|uniref:Uncharacterized protein n=1 Tax=Trichonephila clavipes TaxID=2585209 RepID=A0A8X6VUM6_TRICX|nr:hypothetical protein TNCV_2180121 [Trichonephila clavipes]
MAENPPSCFEIRILGVRMTTSLCSSRRISFYEHLGYFQGVMKRLPTSETCVQCCGGGKVKVAEELRLSLIAILLYTKEVLTSAYLLRRILIV